MTRTDDTPQAPGISPETRTKIEEWIRRRAKGLGRTGDGLSDLLGLPPSDLETRFAKHDWTPIQIANLADKLQITQARAREILKGKLDEWSVERPSGDTHVYHVIIALNTVGDRQITLSEFEHLVMLSSTASIIMTPTIVAELLKQFRGAE